MHVWGPRNVGASEGGVQTEVRGKWNKSIQPRCFETFYPHCMLASRALQSGYVEGLCACRIGLEAEGFM